MELWGLKTDATFDVWTIEHLLSGLSIGSFVAIKNRQTFDSHLKLEPTHPIIRRFDLIAVLFIAFAWEALEHYLETGMAGARVEYWFQGVEHWSNRLISDPIMLVVGYEIMRRWSVTVLPARILSAIWLIVHIFVFPHSMWLHEKFGDSIGDRPPGTTEAFRSNGGGSSIQQDLISGFPEPT